LHECKEPRNAYMLLLRFTNLKNAIDQTNFRKLSCHIYIYDEDYNLDYLEELDGNGHMQW